MRSGRENGAARLVWALQWVPAINKSRDFTLPFLLQARDLNTRAKFRLSCGHQQRPQVDAFFGNSAFL